MALPTPPFPTAEDLQQAHSRFLDAEPRDLFYRAATELVYLALGGQASLSVAEAVAVLLQTWNRSFYQYQRFDGRHFAKIDALVAKYQELLMAFRARSIDSFCDEDEATVRRLFESFEIVLGPIGAAKSLHLLAPRFFPLWDRAIATGYGLPLGRRGSNGTKYCRFMQIAKAQCESVGGEESLKRNPLKAIDEYNYCKYTKGWL